MTEDLNAQTVRDWGERYSNWGRWGNDDQLGTLNFITRERVLVACAIPTMGRVISCALRVYPLPAGSSPDGESPSIPLPCATQWDALARVSYDGKMYNGQDAAQLSIDHASENRYDQTRGGVISRGVLLDLPRYTRQPWLENGTRIRPADLDACAEAFGFTVEPGDTVLVRTGMMARCREQQSWAGYFGGPAPGLSALCARWIYEREIAAIATDTWGIEVRPYETPDCSQPLHLIAVRNMGLLIGEVFDLDALAEACAEDQRYEFLFTAASLPTSGSASAPINPLAIK
ncbi:MAG: cyclase family protein [Myxococcales bacterium]|nr:cyclase family protein [Myxococcales bacterium]